MADHKFSPDRFNEVLPAELQLRVLGMLSVQDLCIVERVSQSWRANRLLNEVWWQHCMHAWWASARERPRRMQRADHRRDWKTAFARLTPAEAAPTTDVDCLARRRAAKQARQPDWAREDEQAEVLPGQYKHQVCGAITLVS